jgi:hypothetical protein
VIFTGCHFIEPNQYDLLPIWVEGWDDRLDEGEIVKIEGIDYKVYCVFESGTATFRRITHGTGGKQIRKGTAIEHDHILHEDLFSSGYEGYED